MLQTSDFLEQHREKTEQILQKAIGEWQMLPPEQLSTSPDPGRWSAAQCMEHLNIYGHHYLPAIEKAIETGRKRGTRPANRMNSGFLGGWFTGMMRPQPDGSLKSAMQSPKNAVPSEQPEPRAVLAEFIDQQEKMLALLDAATTINLNTLYVPTSLSAFIRMRLGDTLAFVIAHNERHVLQAGKALTTARKIFV